MHQISKQHRTIETKSYTNTKAEVQYIFLVTLCVCERLSVSISYTLDVQSEQIKSQIPGLKISLPPNMHI